MVNATTSAYGTGLGIALPATRPMKWAASTMRIAPTSSAMLAERLEVDEPRDTPVAPQMIIFGRSLTAMSRTSS